MLPVIPLARAMSDAGGGDVVHDGANEEVKLPGDEKPALDDQRQDDEDEVKNDPSNEEENDEEDADDAEQEDEDSVEADEEDADDAEQEDKDSIEADDEDRPLAADGIDNSNIKKTKSHEENPLQRDKGDILEKVERFLKGKEFVFSVDHERDLIRMSMGGRHSTYNVVFDAREESRQLFVYACISNRVPEDRRIEMAQFVARANYGMSLGGFEFDMSDGEIRFKVTVDVEEGELSCKMVQNMYEVAFGCAERYLCGIMGVCYAGKDAAEAVAEAEGKLRFILQ